MSTKLRRQIIDNVAQSSSVDLEIVKLEARLAKKPDDLDILLQLAELYMQIGRRSKIAHYVVASLRQYIASPASAQKGMVTAATGMRFWRAERYSNKEQLRLNITQERSDVLLSVEQVLHAVEAVNDGELAHRVSVQLATAKALRGEIKEALAIFSELITVQAMDAGMEYMCIIFHAAVLLKHIGQNAQAIEYLEFLIDDPPVTDGYSKMHILAFLVLVYEQSGSHYSIVKERTYDELLSAYQAELSKGNRPVTNMKKIENLLSKKKLSESSEIWEMLGLQAVERCDYIFAIELLRQAVAKVTTKSRLFFLLAELYFLTNNFDQSLIMAEKAFHLNPQSAELRNLLLILAPEKWTDKIRSLTAVPHSHMHKSPEDTRGKSGTATRLDDDDGDGDGDAGSAMLDATKKSPDKRTKNENWIARVKHKAENALKHVQEEVVPKVNDFILSRTQSPPVAKRQVIKPSGDLAPKSKENEKTFAGAGKRRAQDKGKYNVPKKPHETDIRGELPSKPSKPELDCSESRILFHKILEGDVGHTYIYDKDLLTLMNIRKEAAELEEAQMKARMKAAAQGKKTGGGATIPSAEGSVAPSATGSAKGADRKSVV